MANKNVTKKEVLDRFSSKAETFLTSRKQEVKECGLLDTIERDALVEAVTSAVISDVYSTYVKGMRYNRYAVRPGDMFEADGKKYIVAEVLEPFENEVVMVYFEKTEDGSRTYECKTVSFAPYTGTNTGPDVSTEEGE